MKNEAMCGQCNRPMNDVGRYMICPFDGTTLVTPLQHMVYCIEDNVSNTEYSALPIASALDKLNAAVGDYGHYGMSRTAGILSAIAVYVADAYERAVALRPPEDRH
jgi:hypothetical protein